MGPLRLEYHPRVISQREKLSYCRRGHLPMVLFGLFSGLLLVIGLTRFALTESLIWVAIPFVLMNGLYLALSYAVMLSGSRFRLDSHQRLVERWRGTSRARSTSIDVFLPVCGEAPEAVLATWAGVRELKWHGPVNVYVLDDSPDDRFREDAKAFGFHYLRRGSRHLRKAGNLQQGFSHSSGELILLLDADFRPHPEMLEELVPYLLEFDDLAIVQSPQYFDVCPAMGWIEAGAGYVQELFYRLIQPARDAWGAGVCVGSCALYRRRALASLNGCAAIDHSEDLWTGFELQHLGWQLKYVPIVLAKGLCPSRLPTFYSQQYRWCRGSLSLVADRRFWTSRLSAAQKLCYFAGFMYYVATAMNTVLTPLPPLVMVALFPGWVHWQHLAFSLLALIYTPFVIGLWSTYPFGLHFLTTREVSGAAHLQAVVDGLRGSMQDWVVTGGGSGKRSSTAMPWALASLVMTSAIAAAGIWGLSLWTLSHVPGRWFHFFPPLFFSGLHALVCGRVLFSLGQISLGEIPWKLPASGTECHRREWMSAGTFACLGILPALAVVSLASQFVEQSALPAAPPPGSFERLIAEERRAIPFQLSSRTSFSPYTISEAFPGVDTSGTMRLREHPTQSGVYYLADHKGVIREVRREFGKWTSCIVVDLRESDLNWLYSFDIHPRFPADPRLFLCYSTDPGTEPICFRLISVTLAPGRITGPEDQQIFIEQRVESTEHLAGDLAFDARGCLLVSCGDNAHAGKDYHSQQIDGGFFSGVLRIDVDCRGGDFSHPPPRQPINGRTAGYDIPNDNPFCDVPNALEEFWSLGLRNPFRISFDVPTEQLWIGDVGQDRLEQIEIATAGSNHLWSFQEGTQSYSDSIHQGHVPQPVLGRPVSPFLEYPHEDLNLCVVGGQVYRGGKFPELRGRYLFGDNRSGRIWSIDPADPDQQDQLLQLPFGNAASSLVSLSADRAGNIFFTNFTSSPGVYRIQRSLQPLFPERLSETGFLKDVREFRLREDFIPYEVAVPLWSDGMHKRRWISLPVGARIDNASSPEHWRFPPGTVFVKHFEFPGADLKPIPIETRILVVREDGTSLGASYRWDHETRDARLQQSRRQIPFPDGMTRLPYQIPGPADCLVCHHRERPVLGFNLEQLNINSAPALSPRSQLRKLSELNCFAQGYTEQQASQLPQLARIDDRNASIERRARSYLHANCSFCHNPKGPEHVKLDLRLEARDFRHDVIGAPAQLGYHRIDGQQARQLIAPGIPEASAIWLRLQTLDRRYSMPYLGRTRPDHAAVELIADWIDSLAPNQSISRPTSRPISATLHP
jgi:cellulose synthase (UDP-forming)